MIKTIPVDMTYRSVTQLRTLLRFTCETSSAQRMAFALVATNDAIWQALGGGAWELINATLVHTSSCEPARQGMRRARRPIVMNPKAPGACAGGVWKCVECRSGGDYALYVWSHGPMIL